MTTFNRYNKYKGSYRPYNRNNRSRYKRPYVPLDAFEKEYPRNFRIRSQVVRVISSDGKNLGEMPLKQAVYLAKDNGLDLVQIVGHVTPPVCKMVNWESFKYKMQKKEKQKKKQSKASKLKEIKMSPKIADSDFNRKLEQVKKFFGKGYQVKLTLMKKRRITFDQMKEFQEKVLTSVKEYSTIVNIQNKGRNIYILLKANSNGKKEDKEETK